MCGDDHKNERIIKTTGQYYIIKCLDCGNTRKKMKVKEEPKKTLLQKIFCKK